MKLRPFACVNTRTVCFCIITQLPPERRSVILSGSVSPLPWTGSKGCIYTTIDAFMPPHKTYVEACMGSAEVFLRKKPAEREIINDYNGDLVKFFRVLQQNEKLAYYWAVFICLSIQRTFRINKAMLADVPNILDDLTETSATVEKADGRISRRLSLSSKIRYSASHPPEKPLPSQKRT